MKQQKGFTLLELLVVIGIIGILVSLITVSFSNAQRSSRDSRRRQDLVAIQNAMEQYYSQNDFEYPVCSGSACDLLTAPTNYFATVAPTDPLSTQSYNYISNATSYTVTATLEKCPPAPALCTIQVANLQ